MGTIRNIIRQLALATIRLYQRLLSPDHSWLQHRHPYGYCRFRPTCSDYSYQAIERYGLGRGTWLAIRRIVRCNPFNQGGEDPLI